MAKELGKSVRELFDSMSIYEFQMWHTYFKEYPFGDYRNDLREALNCAILLAPHSERDLDPARFLLVKEDEIKEEKPVENLVDKTKAMIRGMRPTNGRK